MTARTRDVTLSIPMIEAVLNADEAGGRINASEVTVKALHTKGLADAPHRPSYLTDDGREIVRQTADYRRRTFTIPLPDGDSE